VSQTVEWYTPAHVFVALGSPVFDLDVASPGAGVVPWIPALRHFTRAEDGLTAEWPAGAFLWCNPPYGRGMSQWCQRVVDHATAGGSGVLLVFSRTENAWWRVVEHTPGALVAFWTSRMAFVSSTGETPGVAGCGTALWGWGERGRAAVRAVESNGRGRVWRRGEAEHDTYAAATLHKPLDLS
jgi:hypothetical protein